MVLVRTFGSSVFLVQIWKNRLIAIIAKTANIIVLITAMMLKNATNRFRTSVNMLIVLFSGLQHGFQRGFW